MMDVELIESVTRMVLDKMKTRSDVPTTTMSDEPPTDADGMVRVWDHLKSTAKPKMSVSSGKPSMGEFHAPPDSSANPSDSDDCLPELHTQLGVENPHNQEELLALVRKTPSRIGIGRAGLRPKTEAWLKFRLDHAAAVDAVYGEVSTELLESLGLFTVETQVTDHETYIRRPDLGRRLSAEAIQVISKQCISEPKVQIIVSNGLSAQAIETNLEDVLLSLQQSLTHLGLTYGTSFYIQKGRVGVMDDVGEVLRPEVAILIIGERPGLLSAESLSAYMCYKPRRGTIEADRMVISNIHAGGIPPAEAGAYLGDVIQKMLHYQASGISLVQKEASARHAGQD